MQVNPGSEHCAPMRGSADKEAQGSRIDLYHFSVQPTVSRDIVKIGMQGLFARGRRQARQLRLVTVAARRYQIKRCDRQRRIMRLGKMMIERGDSSVSAKRAFSLWG
ncbi:hypothetical protein WJ59_15550 [Burkholderia gladioli]|nr:hypothetical protein WJ59_15550 [Burkholderia gladioli]